jgi:hypothetical protein
VFDRATHTQREYGLDQAAAERLAYELNENNRIYLELKSAKR